MGFTFKQFVIDDTHCGQKVGTDSIILGSWSVPHNARRVLDIGTGSGLLLLMQRQQAKNDTIFVGIDVDSASVKQACKNIQRTGWSNVEAHCIPVQEFKKVELFDLIISNPPYFNSNSSRDLPSNRTHARQRNLLNFEQLLYSVNNLLSPTGFFRLILPYEESENFTDIAREHDLHCSHQCNVLTTPSKMAKRTLLEFQRVQSRCIQNSLIVRDLDGQYTEQYRHLCRDFYLKF